jgi:menaquinone-dependent protoporphyrinogen oxidase
MRGKTLVAYATKGGATREIAEAIAETLRGCRLEVDVVDLRKERKVGLSGYENVVAGAGVRAGKIYGEFMDFASNDFGGRKVAMFIVCGEASGPEGCKRAAEKHMQAIKARNPALELADFGVFGGRMRILWKTVLDSVDSAKARQWAEGVGKKFAAAKR